MIIPAKAFPTSGIAEIALRKKNTDDPKYATKNRSSKYWKNGAPFPVGDSPTRK